MPTFKNIKELSDYFNKNSDSVLQNSFHDKQSFQKAMQKEAETLRDLIKQGILNYYASYQPKKYAPRTYDWLHSLTIAPPMVMDNTIVMSIYFDNTIADHPSLWGGEDGYVPWLFEVGWKWKSRPPQPYMLGQFEGAHYVQHAIETYNRTNPYGIEAHAFHNGERIY